jgi:hypothetical protein
VLAGVSGKAALGNIIGLAIRVVMLRRRLKPSLSMEAAFENLLGRRFYTAFTPTPNIGTPRQ